MMLKKALDKLSGFKTQLSKPVKPKTAYKIRHLGSPIENMNLARTEYQEGKTVLESLPPIITFALTTYCNNQIPCLICDRNTRPESSDTEVNRQIIDAAKPLLQTAQLIYLHCGGEAMLSRHYDEVISSINPPTKIGFATNAMLLTKKRADLMLERDIVAGFVISLDASTPETYRIMRPSCDFETVTKNISYYTEKMKTLNYSSNIALNITICESNLKDVPNLVNLAQKVGASAVKFGHLNVGLTHNVKTVDGSDWDYVEQSRFADPSMHDEIIYETYERADKLKIKINFDGRPFIGPNAKEYELKIKPINERVGIPRVIFTPEVKWESQLHKKMGGELPPCFKPWQETVIQPNGDIRICYFHDETQFKIGNLVEDDFMSIWNSDVMVNERTEFLAKSVSSICKKSQPCIHRGRQ